MWTIIKYKRNEYENMISNLKSKIGEKIKFYNPRIKYTKKNRNKVKFFTNYILEGYAFCFCENFKKKIFLSNLQYTVGVDYFLDGYIQSQNQIIKFIKFCKKNENLDGNLQQEFFFKLQLHKAKFLNGPFSNLIFEILEKRKNNIKGTFGSMNIIINKKSNLFYNPTY